MTIGCTYIACAECEISSLGLVTWTWCRGMPGIFRRHCSQSCVYSDETTWRPLWFKTPEMTLRDSKFQMSLDASALKNLCLWCECQSRLPFTISLLIVYYYMELNFARSLSREISRNFERWNRNTTNDDRVNFRKATIQDSWKWGQTTNYTNPLVYDLAIWTQCGLPSKWQRRWSLVIRVRKLTELRST